MTQQTFWHIREDGTVEHTDKPLVDGFLSSDRSPSPLIIINTPNYAIAELCFCTWCEQTARLKNPDTEEV